MQPDAMFRTTPQPGRRVEWNHTDCLLCGGEHHQPLVEAADHSRGADGLLFLVVQCQDCGLCFTNPRPSIRAIDQFYTPDYKPHQKSGVRNRKSWSIGVRCFGENLPSPKSGGNRLLDFGCGGGSFLAEMKQIGWEVLGMDFAPEVVQRIQTDLKLPTLAGTLPHPSLRLESFDCITMRHSLEHVHDPATTLAEVWRLLKPGGRVSILAPNIDSLAFRTFGHAWFGLDLPRHLTHFAPWTLELMLHRIGFVKSRVRMIRHSSWLRRSAEIARRLSNHHAPFRWLHSRLGSNLTSWYSCFTRQSDSFQITAVKAA